MVGGDHPRWAYSVGLTERFDHPEVVVYGLPQKTAQGLINAVVERIREGRRFEAGDSASDLLHGDYVCHARTVRKKWYPGLLNFASWFYRGEGYSAVQCLWPDLEGRQPWEANFLEEWKATQPLLYLDDPVESRMGAIVDQLNRPSSGCKCGEEFSDWNFGDDPHRTSISQRHVANGEAPILLACHDSDGDWRSSAEAPWQREPRPPDED